jgi:serine/threonine protein phosphatase 1
VAETNGRLFAIGDIHGCVDELSRLLDAIPAGADDTVVFVGDYIDRGPSARRVIELLLDWRTRTAARAVFLKGNHEDMALAFLGRGGQWGEAWLRNGGVASLRSYDADPHGPLEDVVARIPQAHVDFMASLEPHFQWGPYLIVHAGIRPGVPLAEQRQEDLLWIREEFLDFPHDLGSTVVFGHTPYRRVVVELPYKIGIDTGCVYGGALTCVSLPDARTFQIRLGETSVREDSLAVAARRRS